MRKQYGVFGGLLGFGPQRTMVIHRQSLFQRANDLPGRLRKPAVVAPHVLLGSDLPCGLRIAQTTGTDLSLHLAVTPELVPYWHCDRAIGIATEQSALRLFAQAASASGRYRVNRIGHSSGVIGFPPNSGNTSFNIMTESPMRTLAFSKRPSGEAERLSSTASKACFRNSMYLVAPFTVR